MIDKEIYPNEVDFDYTVRCDKHNFMPYEYCELCHIRSELQGTKTEVARNCRYVINSAFISIKQWDLDLVRCIKKIEELEIVVYKLKRELEK